jgi:hypothetical protein
MSDGLAFLTVPMPDLDEAHMAWTRLGFTFAPRVRDPASGMAAETILFNQGRLHLGPRLMAGIARTLSEGEEALRQLELPRESVMVRARRTPVPRLPLTLWDEYEAFPRRPEWLRHPNTATALVGCVLPIEEAAVAALEGFFGIGDINTTDNVATVHLGSSALTLASADDLLALYPELDEPRPVVRIRAASLEAAANCLADWRIEHEAGPRRIAVAPEETPGAFLEFVR